MKEIIVRGYNLSKQVFHGMSPEQYLDLLEFQDFKCQLSGIEFVYSEEKMKFMDINMVKLHQSITIMQLDSLEAYYLKK
jgi:hypothetical protein